MGDMADDTIDREIDEEDRSLRYRSGQMDSDEENEYEAEQRT